LQVAIKRAAQVVYSECCFFDPGFASPELSRVHPMQGHVYGEVLRTVGGGGPVFYPTLLVSREALRKIGTLDESIVSYQEWDTAIRLSKYYEFAFVAEPTFLYDRRHEGTISKDVLRAAKGYEQVIRKHWWAVFFRAGPKALADHYQTVASYYRRVDDKTQAKRCRAISVLLWPFRPKGVLRRVSRLVRISSRNCLLPFLTYLALWSPLIFRH
jgi:hypothetical protein